MRTCTQCAQPLRADARFCPACGQPVAPPPDAEPLPQPTPTAAQPPSAQPARPGRHAQRRALWITIVCGVLVLAGAGAATALAMSGSPPPRAAAALRPLTTGPTHTTAPGTPGAATRTPTAATGHAQETGAGTVPANSRTRSPTTAAAAPSALTPRGGPSNAASAPADVVGTYYADINAHRWVAAWKLGGNRFSTSYARFVAGYAHTTRVVATIPVTTGTNPIVPIRLLAYTTDHRVQLFAGTYTVRNGQLATAHITAQHSAPATAFAQTSPTSQLAALGYRPDSPLPHDGAPVRAVTATCLITGDGHCQKVFFYRHSTLVGVDTPQPDLEATIVSQTDTGVTIAYPQYHRLDPMCCPSGTPVTVTFQWTGTHILPTTPLPTPVNGR